MKTLYAAFASIGICLLCFWIYVASQHGRVFCDWQRAGIVLTKDGYRSYGVIYSDGLVLSDPPRNLWRWPHYYHTDLRVLFTTNLVISNYYSNYFSITNNH